MEPPDIDVTAPEWNDLDSLLGAHLHQDLYDIHGGPWEAVKDFGSEASPEQRSGAGRALRRLLAEFEDDERLEQAAGRLGMQYDPTYDGYSSIRGWLIAVADYLEDSSLDAEPLRDGPRAGT